MGIRPAFALIPSIPSVSCPGRMPFSYPDHTQSVTSTIVDLVAGGFLVGTAELYLTVLLGMGRPSCWVWECRRLSDGIKFFVHSNHVLPGACLSGCR